MELILQNNLPHQQLPVEAVGDALQEVSWESPKDFYSNPQLSWSNRSQLFTPIIDVKKRLVPNMLPKLQEPEKNGPLNLDIKMETGTGKTYVYTKTIFELHQRYRLNKFIICVPSLPIKAGAEQFLSDLYVQRHFYDACGYHCEIEVGVLEAAKAKKGKRYFPGVVRDFMEGSCQQRNKIYVLLLNMALLTNAQILKRDDYDFGVLGFYRPFDALRATHPVVIIDEPHRFTRSQSAYAQILKELQPQLILRYGATFPEITVGKGKGKHVSKDYLNLLYDLNACEAFSQNLIKGVAKEHFELEGGQRERIIIKDINQSERKVTLQYAGKTETLQAGDPITLSPEMQNVSVDAVEKGLVTLSNGRAFHTSEHFSPSVYAQSYQEEMVKLAIQRHFETERKNFEGDRRIKTLALFFIDNIRSYRGDDNENGWLAEKFESLLKERVKFELCQPCSDDYKAYLEATLKDAHACHGGYFAEDNQNSDEEIAQQVREILHDKKQLLSFKNEDGSWNTRRFIFSKWTLKEGWDNPNVFTICKLRSSGSEISKLQEVGRGLRLPVDEYGNRSSEEHLLNYIVDFDEADFAAKLVAEINGQLPQVVITDKIPMELIQRVAEKRGVNEFALLAELAQKGIIKDLQGTINGDMLGELYNHYPEFADTGLPKSKVIDRNKKNTNKIKIRPQVFDRLRDLWMKINKRYVIFFDPMLEKELEKALPMLFTDGVFAQGVITSKREIVGTDEGRMAFVQDTGVSYQTKGNTLPYNEFLKRINRATSVPIRTLHDAMCKGIGSKPTFTQDLINDQSLARIIKNITNWKIENSMSQFKYKQTAYDVKRTRLTDENGKLYDDIVQSYIGNHLDSARVADRYLYDAYTYDSDLEQTNLKTSDIDEVIVFGKIPRKSIAIPTITNDSYSPDFMYMVKKTDGSKELNIIVETKGVDTPANLRGVEEKKISCAQKFFNQLREDFPELNVNFRDQLNHQQLRTIIDEVLREG